MRARARARARVRARVRVRARARARARVRARRAFGLEGLHGVGEQLVRERAVTELPRAARPPGEGVVRRGEREGVPGAARDGDDLEVLVALADDLGEI